MYVVKARPNGAQRAVLLSKTGDFTNRRENAATFPKEEAKAKAAELKSKGVPAYVTP